MPTAYEIVTESIIKQLESGVAPWRKPWRTELPTNLVSKKEYRGINIFLLASQGYGSRYWVTYRQAQALGGTVKKGQHGSKVVFWKIDEYRKESKETGETENRKSILLRYYTVFNLEQCERIKSPEPGRIIHPIEQCEGIVSSMPNPPGFSSFLSTINRHSRHAGSFSVRICRGLLLHSVSRINPLHRASFTCWPRRNHGTQPIRQ
jgi:hypothetical protein